MTSKNHLTAVALVAIGLAAAVAGCAGESDATPLEASSAEIVIQNAAYQPTSLRLGVGSTVTWRNVDEIGHTVTPYDAGQWGTPGSGDAVEDYLEQGETWSFTFTKAGTYSFRCYPHSYKDGNGQWAGQIGTITIV